MVIYQYQYIIKNVVITASKNYIFREGAVNYLFILHDYLHRKMPVIKMDIELSIPIIADIYENKDTAIIKFDIYEQQIDATGKVVNTTLYMQHMFSIIPAKDQNAYITSQDTKSAKLIDEMKTLQLFEMYLVDMTAVNWFSQQICTIFQDVSKPAALQALFQMRDIPSGILIATPPQDNELIPYVMLPLGDLVGNIDTLNTVYGIYNAYPIIYYDLQYLYCINKYEPNITLPTATDFGTIKFIIANPDTSDQQVPGSYTDMESKTHYINLINEPVIYDYTPKQTSTKFSTITAIDVDGVVSKTTVDDNATKLKYIYQQNSMTVDQLKNEQLNGLNIDVSLNDSAVSFIKPFKTVLFEPDTQYLNLGIDGKEFRITKWSISITREGTGEKSKYIHDVNISMYQPKV